jgi:glycine/D-amino acid oxidase-like deaminating enzyme
MAVFDAAVIGAGVFGAWSAWSLKAAGLSVALVDAYGAGHARASSGGESRIIRMSYGGDPIYSAMAQASLPAWAGLSERQGGQPILHRTGVLWFSPAGDAYMDRSLAWLRERGLEHEAFDTAALHGRYPQIAFRDGEAGFLETGSGVLIAGRGGARGGRRRRAGAGDRQGRAARSRRAGLRGRAGRAGAVPGLRLRPLAAGPVPGLLTGRITPTRQEVYHFGAAAGDTRFAPPALPVWADFNGGDMVYGMPDLEGQGFKLAFDAHGPTIDPDTQDRQVGAAGVARARSYLAERFPGLAGAPLVHARVCQYENSCNGDFLLDRLPGHARVWLVGAGSGHGFKHGPAVGARVRDHLLDEALPIEPRFSLATKAAGQDRQVY